jgi:hypothetical protein
MVGRPASNMHWADLPQVHTVQVTLTPEIEGAISDTSLRLNCPDEALS